MSGRVARRLAVALAACLGLIALLGAPASAHATKPLPRVTIRGKVLLGDAKSFHAVGEVDRRAVFESLPSIKTLKAEKVARNTARYHFLIYEANREFHKAVTTAAHKLEVDLVVDAGGVEAAGIEVADLTASAIEVFKRPVRR